MNTIIMNSENSETSDPRRLLFNFIDNIALRRKKDKFIALSNLGKMEKYKNTWKNIKKTYKNKTFKISAPTWNEEFELSDHILYQIFKIILNTYLKKWRIDSKSLNKNTHKLNIK